eukprot:7391741-Prymnesium_polylepis.1
MKAAGTTSASRSRVKATYETLRVRLLNKRRALRGWSTENAHGGVRTAPHACPQRSTRRAPGSARHQPRRGVLLRCWLFDWRCSFRHDRASNDICGGVQGEELLLHARRSWYSPRPCRHLASVPSRETFTPSVSRNVFTPRTVRFP